MEVTDNLKTILFNASLLWLLLYLVILFIEFRKRRAYQTFTKEELKNSPYLTKVYLDRFYVKNRWITLGATFIYIVGNVMIFLVLRYLAINNATHITLTGDAERSFLELILTVAVVVITIIFYRSLLRSCFYNEVNKCYLYVDQDGFTYSLRTLLEYKPVEYAIGCLRLLFFRIATLTYKEDMYKVLFADLLIMEDESGYKIRNEKVVAWALDMMDLCRRFSFVRKIFRSLAYFFRFIHIHLEYIWSLLPYFILIMAFIIDLYNKEFKHIYLIAFIVFLIRIKRDLLSFINSRDNLQDNCLSGYLYKNKALGSDHPKLIDYIFNNFSNDYPKAVEQKDLGVYRRFYVILILLILSYILLFKANLYTEGLPLVFLVILLPLIIYAHVKTYRMVPAIDEAYCNDTFHYSRIFNIIFWILTVCQLVVFGWLLVRPELLVIKLDLLLELPYDIMKVIKIYTPEEKRMYMYQYLEEKLTIVRHLDIEAYIRYRIRKLDHEMLFESNVRVVDIQKYVDYLVPEMQSFYIHLHNPPPSILTVVVYGIGYIYVCYHLAIFLCDMIW